jgi:hypothetical protein
MTTPEESRNESQPEPPERLAEDLRTLYRPPTAVPPELDEKILAGARRRLAQRRRPRAAWRWSAAAAAAAVLLVSVWILDPLGLRRLPAPLVVRSTITMREDADRDGRVDILDAFLVARRLESGEGVERSWDVTGDGAVDQTDVDAIALAAVRLR